MKKVINKEDEFKICPRFETYIKIFANIQFNYDISFLARHHNKTN